jgi:3-oxoacyl-[acyl-carrier protein] reductase
MSDQQPPVPPVPPAPPAEGVTPPAAPEPPVQPTYPAYGQPAPAYAPPTNTLAIVALVLGFVFPIGGIICGHIARNQIKRTGEGGDGLALAGLILGYAFTALTLLIVIGYLIFIIAMFSTFGAASTYY